MMVVKATNFIARMRAKAAEKEAEKLARQKQQEEEFRASFMRAMAEVRESERTGKPLKSAASLLDELDD